MEIFKDFRFEAAHSLPHLPPGHKCRRMHGHSYRVRVVVRGAVQPGMGWVMDFAELKRAVQPLIDLLDHSVLNEVEGMGVSTAEGLSLWLWKRIKPLVAGLRRVEVWETATSGAAYSGEDEAR